MTNEPIETIKYRGKEQLQEAETKKMVECSHLFKPFHPDTEMSRMAIYCEKCGLIKG